MLYAKNLDIRNKQLESFNKEQTSRLTYLKDFIKELNEDEDVKNAPIKIIEKTYLFGNDSEIFAKAKQLWDDRKSLPFHVDGLIFVPANEPYPNKAGTWTRLFKWKPPHLNSIDFLVETVKGANKRDKLFPYVEVFDDEKDVKMDQNAVTQFKKLKLYTTGTADKFNRRTGKMNRRPFPKLFKEVDIPINNQGQIISKDPLTGLQVEITDDTIVEFSYNEKQRFSWVPIRVRHEKTTRYRTYNDNFGNSYNVALDIWKSIVNPVTEKMITTGIIPSESENKPIDVSSNTVSNVATPYAVIKTKRERLPYQNFHTAYVKKKLLKMVALDPVDSERGSGYLIDFGVCRGGDLNRWKEIDFRKVVGIDADIKCIDEAINRYQNAIDNRYNITFLCGDLSKLIFPNHEAACELTEKITGVTNWKELMKKTLGQKYMFDVVSSQFVIHYFFEDELSLCSYLQNVTDNLKIGGHFVGTTFDGSKVYDFLKRKTHEAGMKGEETIWKITKLYGKKKFTDGRPNWGMAIDVFVNSIGIAHKEYLVSFKYLEKLASEYGLELQQVISFSDMWLEGQENKEGYSNKIVSDIRSMSEAEKKFSFLFSGFIFKKVKNAPDSTYKKIVKLQTKKEKS
jgi:mRNA (guanine-N7-)-methyltransferase